MRMRPTMKRPAHSNGIVEDKDGHARPSVIKSRMVMPSGRLRYRRPRRPISCTPAPWSLARIYKISSSRGARSAGVTLWIWYWSAGEDLILRNFHQSRGCRF